MLAAFAAEFHAGRSRSGLGGDADLRRFSRRHLPDRAARRPLRQARLILTELGVLIVALLAMAAAPTLPALIAASFVRRPSLGFAQVVIPLTAELAPPEKRGARWARCSPACFSEYSSAASRAG